LGNNKLASICASTDNVKMQIQLQDSHVKIQNLRNVNTFIGSLTISWGEKYLNDLYFTVVLQ